VWISEQTAIISLYSINWLVCITETECVYCRPVTSEARVRSQSVHVRFVVEKKALGQVCLPVLLFSPVSVIPPMLHTHHLHAALSRMTNGQSLGTFVKTKFYRKSRSTG